MSRPNEPPKRFTEALWRLQDAIADGVRPYLERVIERRYSLADMVAAIAAVVLILAFTDAAFEYLQQPRCVTTQTSTTQPPCRP